MSKTKITVSLLLVVVLLISASCALIPQKFQDLADTFTAKTTPTPRYIVVTSTPQAAGSGASQMELVFKPCLYNSDCPDAVDLDDMLGAQQRKSYDVKLPYNAQLKLSNGWVAIDEKTLEENLSHIKWIFEVDGVDYFQPEFIVKDAVTTIQDTSTENFGAWVGVIVEGFALNQPVTLVVGHTFTEAVNDGWEDYPAGFTSTITYNFIPQPLDFGAPTMK
ncbi:MAG: hypothetical protein C0410_12555 [Anaerolinea sp.]|nr:hypothetical protein [Anaerolinea sp.]